LWVISIPVAAGRQRFVEGRFREITAVGHDTRVDVVGPLEAPTIEDFELGEGDLQRLPVVVVVDVLHPGSVQRVEVELALNAHDTAFSQRDSMV
jgi:hypothetical protein